MIIPLKSQQQIAWRELRTGASRLQSVLFALIFKELKIKLGKSRLGVIWVLLEPAVSMVVIASIWLVVGREEIDNTHVMLFIGSGFVIFLAVKRGISPIPAAIDANRALLNYPQVKPIDTIFARFFLEMWLHLLAGVLLFFTLWWVAGIAPEFAYPLECLQALAVAMLLTIGLALPLAIYGAFYESLKRAVGIITQPLMILSSVIYSINDLPPQGREILAWNPIVHIISSFRHGAFGVELFDQHDLSYPAMCGLILLGFGFVSYYANRFKLLQK